MAARMPMIATTIISSINVKPRWLPSVMRLFLQNVIIEVSFGRAWTVEGASSMPPRRRPADDRKHLDSRKFLQSLGRARRRGPTVEGYSTDEKCHAARRGTTVMVDRRSRRDREPAGAAALCSPSDPGSGAAAP